jgi:peptide methionine sulfoxide reductase msrA/msrB
MKFKVISLFVLVFVLFQAKLGAQEKMHTNKLTAEEERVILRKGTEAPFTGMYVHSHEIGTYSCKRCGAALYRSEDKFDSECGWPSFDDEIPGAVKRIPDADGLRIEITCAICGAHLGHVFTGEGFTPKNVRHCVNSISMNFIPATKTAKTDTAIFAGGCFWGVEYYFSKAKGVLSTTVGYIGGRKNDPTYEDVCSHTTGHVEAVQVTFDPSKTTYEELARLFFEIHDFTQVDRQGPDVGDQYRSAVFFRNAKQKKTAEKLISLLSGKGYNVATRLEPAGTFWKAEEYHQDYYEKTGRMPYCHARRTVF